MRKFVATLVSLMIAGCSFAGNLFVYAVTGTAEKKAGATWIPLTKRAELNANDIIRVKDGSSLSIVDKSASKIYATGATSDKTVSAIIQSQSSGNAASQQFVAHAVKSLFNGDSDNISHSAAGCTYRPGDAVENAIAKSILAKKTDEAQLNVSNEKSDYGVSFELINRYTGESVVSARTGTEVYFRVKNNSNNMVYVNVIDVASDGTLAECLPIDNGVTLSHLMIPANSVVDLSDYAIELTEPLGTDNLILVALEEPFDLRVVNSVLKTKGVKPDPKLHIGVFSRSVAIMK